MTGQLLILPVWVIRRESWTKTISKFQPTLPVIRGFFSTKKANCNKKDDNLFINIINSLQSCDWIMSNKILQY